MYSTICSIFFNIWCKETYCVDLCSLQKGSFNLVVYMMFQIFFMTFRNESEHCISNKTKLTYKCLSRMKEQSYHQAALLSAPWKNGFYQVSLFFGLEFASIYLKYYLLDISNDEIWRLRAHRLVLGMTSNTQNSWQFSTVLWILGSRSHDNDQSMSTKSLEFVVWDI